MPQFQAPNEKCCNELRWEDYQVSLSLCRKLSCSHFSFILAIKSSALESLARLYLYANSALHFRLIQIMTLIWMCLIPMLYLTSYTNRYQFSSCRQVWRVILEEQALAYSHLLNPQALALPKLPIHLVAVALVRWFFPLWPTWIDTRYSTMTSQTCLSQAYESAWAEPLCDGIDSNVQ